MKNKSILILILFVFSFCFVEINIQATETIIIRKPLSDLDQRFVYGEELLKLILNVTEDEYGDYEIVHSSLPMQRDRMFVELLNGERLHVAFEAVKPEWEEQLIPIRVPIRKGLLGYRLFLIKKSNQKLLSQIETIEQLKQIPTGSGSQWSTAKTYRENGFNLVTEIDYEHLFKLLMNDRFMTFGRGINEIYDEYEQRKDIYPELGIESDLLLYFPLAEYFFVSPKRPKLAERIERGFNKIINDGSFDVFFFKKYDDLIKKSNIKNRRMFKISNPNLSDKTPLNEEKYWYQP